MYIALNSLLYFIVFFFFLFIIWKFWTFSLSYSHFIIWLPSCWFSHLPTFISIFICLISIEIEFDNICVLYCIYFLLFLFHIIIIFYLFYFLLFYFLFLIFFFVSFCLVSFLFDFLFSSFIFFFFSFFSSSFYRFGTSTSEALSTLWKEGGINRLYQGLPFALLQGRDNYYFYSSSCLFSSHLLMCYHLHFISPLFSTLSTSSLLSYHLISSLLSSSFLISPTLFSFLLFFSTRLFSCLLLYSNLYSSLLFSHPSLPNSKVLYHDLVILLVTLWWSVY